MELEKIEELLKKFNDVLETKKHIIKFGIRPENISEVNVKTNATNLSNPLVTEIVSAELLGQEYYVHTFIGKDRLIANIDAINDYKSHDNISLIFDLDKIHLFDYDTTKYII